ncbi:hypothetical protein F5887DRAFT_1061085 [Amanita rubescens]|nr:hypothetical protein F5887DRAFT_1061085 [Amanita rubescens]
MPPAEAEVISFALAVAFSSNPFGGNPAAVVFMDLTQPDEVYEAIAKNLKQPMTAFVDAKEVQMPRTAAFGIRFFLPYNAEVPVSGHALLATAEVNGKILSARKGDDGSLEVRLPSGVPEEVSGKERARLIPYINKAFDREVGYSMNPSKIDLVVEIDAKEDLKNSLVDVEALRGTGYLVHMITSASTTGQELFVSRMFCPAIALEGEVMASGTGHCLVGPYWYRKSTQVSPRGGDLKLVWLEDEGTMVLRGVSTVVARGELYV